MHAVQAYKTLRGVLFYIIAYINIFDVISILLYHVLTKMKI